MNRHWKEIQLIAGAAALVAVLSGCASPVVPGWSVLFSDGFNRTDTTGLDLGSTDWTLYAVGSSASTTMFISGNQVESHFADWSLEITAGYTGTVNY